MSTRAISLAAIAVLILFPAATGNCGKNGHPGVSSRTVSAAGMDRINEQGIPEDAEPVEIRVLFTQKLETGADSVVSQGSPGRGGRRLFVSDRQIISNERQYGKIFKKPSPGIKWSKNRILVFQQCVSSKLGRPFSSYWLTGMYRLGGTLYLRVDFSHEGRGQGIRQLPEWFTYEYTNLFLLIPAKIRKIEYCYPPIDRREGEIP